MLDVDQKLLARDASSQLKVPLPREEMLTGSSAAHDMLDEVALHNWRSIFHKSNHLKNVSRCDGTC